MAAAVRGFISITTRATLCVVALIECCSAEEPAGARPAAPEKLEEAPVYVDEASQAARAALAQFDELLRAEDDGEAVRALSRAIQSDGARLVTAEGVDSNRLGFQRFVTVRQYAQMRLASAAQRFPEVLDAWRRHFDSAAQNRLEAAIRSGDDRALADVAEDHFVTSAGDEALLYLGAVALHRGAYAAARDAWERIGPGLRAPPEAGALLSAPPDAPYWLALANRDRGKLWTQLAPAISSAELPAARLVYPDSNISLADVRARLVWASILEGDADRAELELELLAQLHPDAEGRLGGQFGRYVDLLGAHLEESRQWPRLPVSRDWPTFAGSAARNGGGQREIDIAGPPLWSAPLPHRTATGEQLGANVRRIGERRDGLLSYHPVVVGDLALVQTSGNHVVALRLADGQAVWEAGDKLETEQAVPGQYFGAPRFTLTVADGAAFARLGSPVTAARRGRELSDAYAGRIVAMDLNADGKLLLAPISPDALQWSFDGAPLVDESRLYVAMRRRDDVRTQLHVACFYLADGRLLWRRLAAAAESAGGGEWDNLTSSLLTLADGVVYCNTNLGAVAAFSAADGEARWIVKYPRSAWRAADGDAAARRHLRDLNPCLIYRDLVVAAPSDCAHVFALDAASGAPLWTSPAGAINGAAHLLGVGGDNLIAAGDRLYWIDIYSGELAAEFPGPRADGRQFAVASPRGHGRGLLAAGRVYWPTREEIFVFDQRLAETSRGGEPALRGRIELSHRGATGGNLAAAGDVLLIASDDRLTAFRNTGAVFAAYDNH